MTQGHTPTIEDMTRFRRQHAARLLTTLGLGLSLSALAPVNAATTASGASARIAAAISPSLSSLSAACARAERDSRSRSDNSASGVVRLQTGSSPITWHGAVPGIYRHCLKLALDLQPLPSGAGLINTTTQQLTIGGTVANPQATSTWKVAFALGSRRLGPMVQDLSTWNQLGDGSNRWRGFNSYYFNPTQLSAMLSEARRTKTPLYLLVYQNGQVRRWTVQ